MDNKIQEIVNDLNNVGSSAKFICTSTFDPDDIDDKRYLMLAQRSSDKRMTVIAEIKYYHGKINYKIHAKGNLKKFIDRQLEG